MELDLDHIERIAKQRQEAGGRVAARPEVILAMVSRIRSLESASQPGIDALATAMHHAAIKYASGDLVDFQHEAREFLLASQPGSGEDTARLDYLIDDGAVVDTITNFEGEKRYQLSWPDLGESQNVWYHSARVAIDASRASLDGRREV